MQSPQAAKINQADRVIDNSGTLDELYAQLDAIWATLKVTYPRRMARLPIAANVDVAKIDVDSGVNAGASSGS
jgi:hypothetical protein